jgi:hypothetical protein
MHIAKTFPVVAEDSGTGGTVNLEILKEITGSLRKAYVFKPASRRILMEFVILGLLYFGIGFGLGCICQSHVSPD